jgi:glycosyltransferase involved in cell wall biosynthesis
VGTLKPWHGVDTLVRAVATLGDVHLRVVGDGPEGEGLRELAQRLGLADRVVFTGAVDPASLPAELARVHVAAAPYPEPDGYFSPLKVFEYLAAGRPVVASRSGQLREVLTHGHDALLVPPGDQGALVAALARLRDDPVERARLAQAARRTASRHTWTAVVARSLEAAGLSTEPAEVAS